MLQGLPRCSEGIADPREPTEVEHRLVEAPVIATRAVLAHLERFEGRCVDVYGLWVATEQKTDTGAARAQRALAGSASNPDSK